MEPGTSGVHGAAALVVGLEGWVPDRGHASLQDTEGRTCVWDLMRRLGKPAMSRKPAVLAHWALHLYREMSSMILTLMELPWTAGVTPSRHVCRFYQIQVFLGSASVTVIECRIYWCDSGWYQLNSNFLIFLIFWTTWQQLIRLVRTIQSVDISLSINMGDVQGLY